MCAAAKWSICCNLFYATRNWVTQKSKHWRWLSSIRKMPIWGSQNKHNLEPELDYWDTDTAAVYCFSRRIWRFFLIRCLFHICGLCSKNLKKVKFKLGLFWMLKLAMLILVLQFLFKQRLLLHCICSLLYANASKSSAYANFSIPDEQSLLANTKE